MKQTLALFILALPFFIFAQNWRSDHVSSLMSYRYQHDAIDSLTPHGEFEIYYRGTKQASGHYDKGKRVGTWKQFYNTGQVMVEGAYDGDKKKDKWRYFYPNGSLKSEINYIDDVPYGSWKSYHKSGDEWASITYTSPDKPSEVIVRDTAGIKMMHRLSSYDSVNSSRVDSIFYTNGKLAFYGEYENGVLDGPVLTFYPDGEFREELVFQEGRLTHVKETYTQTGQQMPTGSLYEGAGTRLIYNAAGKKIAILMYKDGLLHGEQSFLYENGKVRKSFRCEFDQKKGLEQSFSPNGVMREAIEYDYQNNKIISTVGKSLDYGNRTIIEYDTNWVKHGVQRELDMVGNVIHEIPYSFGLKNGVERYYQKTRLGVEHEINYSYGDKVEYERWYNPAGKIVYEAMYPTFSDEVELDSSWISPKLNNGVMYKTAIDFYFRTRDFRTNRSIGELGVDQERVDALQEPVYIGAVHVADEYTATPLYQRDDVVAKSLKSRKNSYNKKEQEFRASFSTSKLRHELGITGFISANLKLPNNLQDFENTGINAIFTMYIDEFGLCLKTTQHKTDAIGLSDAIQELMPHAPLSEPASICGLPVFHRATVLYAH